MIFTWQIDFCNDLAHPTDFKSYMSYKIIYFSGNWHYKLTSWLAKRLKPPPAAPSPPASHPYSTPRPSPHSIDNSINLWNLTFPNMNDSTYHFRWVWLRRNSTSPGSSAMLQNSHFPANSSFPGNYWLSLRPVRCPLSEESPVRIVQY